MRRTANPCKVLAYVIGALLGNEYAKLDRRKGYYMIVLAVKDHEFTI